MKIRRVALFRKIGGRAAATASASVALRLFGVLAGAAASARASSSPSTTAPWQDPDLLGGSGAIGAGPGWREEERLYADLPHNVFDPSGRLRLVEKILPLSQLPSDPSGTLVIAIRCRDGGIAVVSSLPRSPYLYDPPPPSGNNATTTTTTTNTTTNAASTPSNSTATENYTQPLLLSDDDGDGDEQIPKFLMLSTTPFCRLTSRLFGVSAGNAVDSQWLRTSMFDASRRARRSSAASAAEDDDSPWSARVAARYLADAFQRSTQDLSAGGNGRLLASSAVLVGCGPSPSSSSENGGTAGEIWRVDPTGDFYRCRVAVAGRAAGRAESELLRMLREKIRRTEQRQKGNDDDAQQGGDDPTKEGEERSEPLIGRRAVRDQLSVLQEEEALALAAKAILSTLEALEGKEERGHANNSAVRIRGFCTRPTTVNNDDDDVGGVRSKRSSPVLRWYSQNDLSELVRKHTS